jgi:threonine/homoserine/homoserine lactone efflux protein
MSAAVICAAAIVIAFLGSMPLAGPVAILTLSRAASGRFQEALRIGLGAAAAEGIYAGFAYWGFATFLPHHRLVAPISEGATSVLLVVLGTRFVFWHPPPDEKKDPGETKTGTALLGFSISALNPTLLVSWTTVVAFLSSRGTERHSVLLALPFGASAGVGVATWFACLVKLLQRLENKLPVKAFRWTIRTMGVALVVIGVGTGARLVRWMMAP